MLTSFSGQRIDIDIRDDYWGGESHGVNHVRIVPSGTVGNIQSAISRGDVDWADGGGAGVLTQFLGMNEDNHYDYFPDGSSRGVVFGTTQAPLDDAAVRRALRDSVDLGPAAQAAGVGYQIPSPTGLSTDLYSSMLLEEYNEPLSPDVTAAKASLTEAGWSIKDGDLTKDGTAYPLKLYVNLKENTDVVVGPMLVDQWKTALGVNVEYVPTSDTVFEANYKDYGMFIWNTNLSGSPYSAYQAYSWSNLAPEKQALDYGNRGLWRMPRLSSR